MAAIQHVFKRGSIYWWRRRLPIGTSPCSSVRTELSLRAKELELARTIAAEVTLVSHRLVPGLKTKMISSEDAKKILVQVAMEHGYNLDSIMSFRERADHDPDAGRRGDIGTGWPLKLYAAQHDRAEVGPAEERELRAAGLDDDMLQRVRTSLDFFKNSGFGGPGRKKLEGILAQHDISLVDIHLRQAEALYIRGMSAALLNTERRWSGVRTDDLALLQSAYANGGTLDAVAPQAAILPNQGRHLHLDAAVPVPPLPSTAVVPLPAVDPELDEEDEVDDGEPDGDQPGLVALVTRASEERVASKEWDTKTGRQHIKLAMLFIRFVGHDNPGKMRQAHIANFKSIF